MNTIIVNLYGGPGSGKSTMAARLFSELKESGIVAELVTEYAKDLTWQESYHELANQIYIFGKQQHRIWRVYGKVEVIITDSPLLLGLIYGDSSDTFKKLVVEEYQSRNSIDIFLERVKPYSKIGRSQTEEEARQLDSNIKTVLDMHVPSYYTIPGIKSSTDHILELIKDSISNLKLNK